MIHLDITTLDVLETALCMALVCIAVCRLESLKTGRSAPGAIAAMLALLTGAGAVPLLHLYTGEHSTVGGFVFVSCVFVAAVAGTQRWRDGAPPETFRRERPQHGAEGEHAHTLR